MTKIALFGGAFDPVHLGHIKVAESILEQLSVNYVWFVPTSIHPDKEKTMFTLEERITFLKKIVSRNPKFSVCDHHLHDVDKRYTFYLVKALQSIHQNTEFSFIIGADNVTKLKNWHRAKELLEMINFIVIDREVFDKKNWKKLDYYNKLQFISMPLVDISSSTIREKIKLKLNFADLVPVEVIEMIQFKDNKHLD